MPNPWSNEYDKDRARTYKDLQDNGVPESDAKPLTRELVREEDHAEPVDAPTDRAYGPKGER